MRWLYNSQRYKSEIGHVLVPVMEWLLTYNNVNDYDNYDNDHDHDELLIAAVSWSAA